MLYILYSKCFEDISQIVSERDSVASPINLSIDAFHVRARTHGVTALTARHPFWMRLGFLACYNSDNYVTNASKDKELLSDVDGSLARESQKRHGCLVAQLPVILPL